MATKEATRTEAENKADDANRHAAGEVVNAKTNERTQTDTRRTNINHATREQLQAMCPQIGIERADSIIRWREAMGPFASVEGIADLPGFGQKLMKFIRPFATVEGGIGSPEETK